MVMLSQEEKCQIFVLRRDSDCDKRNTDEKVYGIT